MRYDALRDRVDKLPGLRLTNRDLIHRLKTLLPGVEFTDIHEAANEIDVAAFDMDGVPNAGILLGIMIGIEAVTGIDLRCEACNTPIRRGTVCGPCGRDEQRAAREASRQMVAIEHDPRSMYN